VQRRLQDLALDVVGRGLRGRADVLAQPGAQLRSTAPASCAGEESVWKSRRRSPAASSDQSSPRDAAGIA
jgi:hypothetical protein